jgi:hypothetical protein
MVCPTSASSGRRERYPDESAGAPLMRNTFDRTTRLSPRYALRWIPGSTSTVIAVEVALVLFGSAVFVILAVFAHRRVKAAFVVALILYGLDTLLFIAIGDFLGLAFHALALYYVFIGMGAAAQLGPVSSQLGAAKSEHLAVESAFDTGD